MPTDTGPHLQLDIAHVPFVDEVGYSKLLIDEQRTLLEELNHIIRNTAEFRKAEAQEDHPEAIARRNPSSICIG